MGCPSLVMASQVRQEDPLNLIDRINAATQAVDKPEAYGSSNGPQDLLLEHKSRSTSLEDPDAEVWPRAFQVNVSVSIDIAETLGLWEKLRSKESITISEVVKDKKANVAATGQLQM